MTILVEEKIPKELKPRDQWVGWVKKKGKAGKKSKVPINPNKKKSAPASVSDPETWGRYKKAIEAYERLGIDGIGFVFTKNDHYVGIDLDKCRDPKTGKIDAEAMAIVKALQSYTEISPSGTGLHIISKASLVSGKKGKTMEIYGHGRYFTMTGRHLEGTPLTIENRESEIQDFVNKYFPPEEIKPIANQKNNSNSLSDDEIIQKAKKAENGAKFSRLWKGNINDYGSHSEADIALCGILCYWVGPDKEPIDRIFRRSKLYRSKWDKKHRSDGRTYGQITIDKAIKSTDKFYDPDKNILDKIVATAELFHTPLQQAYATVQIDDHYETWPVEGEQFENLIRHQHYNLAKKPLKDNDFNSFIKKIKADALFGGLQYDLDTRVAGYDGAIYLDLVNPKGEVVKITSTGWEITKKHPVKFRRKPGMLALPHPTPKGKISDLFHLLNIDDASYWVLTVAWLIGAFRPTGPYTIMLVLGPQGSAKSTQARILKSILDPSKASLRTAPRSERDLAISATNSHILTFDNFSYLKDWLSDAFCRLATGGGLATRRLHTDGDEMIFDFVRPIIINGIDVLAYGHDLIDRCVIMNLPQIDNANRVLEKEIYHKFEERHPSILGGLCDAVSMAIKNFHKTKLSSLPRMADFAQWVVAASPSLPFDGGEFLKFYESNQRDSVQRSLNSDPVAMGVIELMKLNKKWSGTATDLLKKLEGSPKNEYANALIPRTITMGKAWPKAPHALSNRLRRCSTFLKTIGIEVTFSHRTSEKREIIIKKGTFELL